MTTLAEALAPRSDQLNADDLIPGPRVLRITGARIAKDGRDIKVVLNFEGDNGKPWKPCKTMGRAMVMTWKITEPEQFVGKSVRVYRDPTVRFGDQGEVGGIRVSHMSDIDKPVNVKLTVSQGKKGMFTFHPLVAEVREQPEDRAAKWAADFTNVINASVNLETLNAHLDMRDDRLKELASKRPELHLEIMDAVDAKRATFENPAAAEGKPDSERGEGFTDDDGAF